ncbi:MAG: FkbM family methyltransferase [Pseudomonadota bacterium]
MAPSKPLRYALVIFDEETPAQALQSPPAWLQGIITIRASFLAASHVARICASSDADIFVFIHACEKLHEDAHAVLDAGFSDPQYSALWCRDAHDFGSPGTSIHRAKTPASFEEFLLWNPLRISSYGYAAQREALQELAIRFPKSKGYVFSALLWRYGMVSQLSRKFCYCYKSSVQLDQHVYRNIFAYLQENPLLTKFSFHDQMFYFAVCALRDGIHWSIINGWFPEHRELKSCAKLLDSVTSAPVIYDVGTNIGTHSVYFAKIMQASLIVPFEITPLTIKLYRMNMQLNNIVNVIMDDHMGIGLGAAHATKRLDTSRSDEVIGTWRVGEEGVMDIAVAPLDSFTLPAPDLIKIDVEGSEMDVLYGAEKTITKHRPQLFIEVLDYNKDAFDRWVEDHGYRIVMDFPYGYFYNFLLQPQEQAG